MGTAASTGTPDHSVLETSAALTNPMRRQGGPDTIKYCIETISQCSRPPLPMERTKADISIAGVWHQKTATSL